MYGNQFKTAYMNLPRVDKHNVKIRNKIVSKCEISTAIFYNWLKGFTPVPHWAKPSIAEILNKPVNELFPETI